MSGNTMFARTENSMDAVESVKRSASGTGFAFVARVSRVAKVIAASTLQQISASRRHVAKLRRSARQQSLRKYRVFPLNGRIVRQIAVAHHGADSHSATRHLLNFVERQQVNIH